jgi:hypothetical protein
MSTASWWRWCGPAAIRPQGAEACYLKFRRHPIDAQCLPAKSRFVLAIEREPLAGMLREESRARRDTQFQRFPNQGRVDPANLFPQGASQASVTWMRKGTLGSIGGAGVPPIPTIQALLIARSRLSRALCTSWSKMVVALVSESQLIVRPRFDSPAIASGVRPALGVPTTP